MREILTITRPIYLPIALGYIATRFGLFAKSDLRTLGRFVVNLAIPALLFNAIARRSADDLLDGDYLLAYAVGSLVLLAFGWLSIRRFLHAAAKPSAVSLLEIVCSNSGFVGYPIVLLTFAQVYGLGDLSAAALKSLDGTQPNGPHQAPPA